MGLKVGMPVKLRFNLADPDKPNIAGTIFRTVQDLTGQRYCFDGTYAPNVVWVTYDRIDFSPGRPEMELKVEKLIFELNGDVTDRFQEVPPLVFGMNKK
jgi:choloylglycine hydrolase